MMLYIMNLLIILIVWNFNSFHYFKEKPKLEKTKKILMKQDFNKKVFMNLLSIIYQVLLWVIMNGIIYPVLVAFIWM